MADDDRTSAARLYAVDVALDPPINGAGNVQDALAAGGGVVLGNETSDEASADDPTSLTGDGALTAVACLVADPPEWLDNAGNIIAPGLYAVWTFVAATAGPTTPGLGIRVTASHRASDMFSCDLLGVDNVVAQCDVQALAVGDVPNAVRSNVQMPTDATEAVDITIVIARLAH